MTASKWEENRTRVLRRLARIHELIDLEDEGEVLALLNQQDEFCQEAARAHSRQPRERGDEPDCHFCVGFLKAGGCLGMVAKIDHAVLRGEWEEAGRVADEYVDWIRSLPLPS